MYFQPRLTYSEIISFIFSSDKPLHLIIFFSMVSPLF
uniref:Uncharacterized protein n=1 Tax=virus sp. ctQ5V6 TaxID=2825815 RepID=A0A8S5RQM0_9VIRU|nr:MAG TPA: hypothetical protein [virus sp. ctQ5V6]